MYHLLDQKILPMVIVYTVHLMSSLAEIGADFRTDQT